MSNSNIDVFFSKKTLMISHTHKTTPIRPYQLPSREKLTMGVNTTVWHFRL